MYLKAIAYAGNAATVKPAFPVNFSVTPLRFYSLFAFCITVAPQRRHGQPICTPK